MLIAPVILALFLRPGDPVACQEAPERFDVGLAGLPPDGPAELPADDEPLELGVRRIGATEPRLIRCPCCGEASAMPRIPDSSSPWKTAEFSAMAMRWAASSRGVRSESTAPRSWSARMSRERMKSLRNSTAGRTTRCSAVTPPAGSVGSGFTRPRFAEENCQP